MFGAIALLVAACSVSAAGPLAPYLAWQFHKLNVPYISETMRLVAHYDVNTPPLFDGSGRGEKLRQLARALDPRMGKAPPASVGELQRVADDLAARLAALRH